jgi:acyl-CoA thioester hydrolase
MGYNGEMANAIAEYPLLIREHHLDTFGHVNNAVYLEIFEEARWEIVTPRGFDLAHIRKTGQGPVILEIQLRFLQELRLRSKIVIYTQLESYEGKIGMLRQWIVDDNGKVCCEAHFKIALFDLHRRKIIAPTPEWLQAIGADMKS